MTAPSGACIQPIFNTTMKVSNSESRPALLNPAFSYNTNCRLRSRANETLTEYEQGVFYALNHTNAQSAVDSGLLEPNHQRKPGMPMTNLISENTPIGQRLIVQKNEPNLWQEAANRTKEKLVRFPPIDRVLADIVQNKQFQDA